MMNPLQEAAIQPQPIENQLQPAAVNNQSMENQIQQAAAHNQPIVNLIHQAAAHNEAAAAEAADMVYQPIGDQLAAAAVVNRPLRYSWQDLLLNRMDGWIDRFCVENAQTEEQFACKLSIRDKIFTHAQTIYHEFGTYAIGSTMSGFASVRSDLDLCFMLEADRDFTKYESLRVLRHLDEILRHDDSLMHVRIIEARVPILRFRDRASNIQCDLNVNNRVGLRNTKLLRSYNNVDVRVSQLVLVVKHWARRFNINDASNGTLSSYSLELMVLHYLQAGCAPPVLPSLQKLAPEIFSSRTRVSELDIYSALPPYKIFNIQNTGDLFVGFIQYFSNYNYGEDIVSVRLGGTFQASSVPYHWLREKRFMCNNYIKIEEPFSLMNTAQAVYEEKDFERIREAFKKSSEILRDTDNNIFAIL